MEFLNLEKFIFFIKTDYSSEKDNSIKSGNKKAAIIMTLNSIYTVELDQIKYDENFGLETNIMDQIPHENLYLSDFEDIKSSLVKISLSKRDEKYTIKLEFKDSVKEARDFLYIMILFDGYKLTCQQLGIDYSINLDWLKYIVDNYLTNNYFLVDDNFFTIEEDFLVNIVNYLSKFEKFVISLKFHNQIGINFFMRVFVATPIRLDIKKLSLIKSLKLVSNDLNDRSFKQIVPMFSTTISLTELEISKNHISGESLKEISFYFISHLKYLEKMTFTNNWIDSYCIEDFIKNALDNLLKISYIDLSNNFLDNDFLKAFDFYLRKSKYDRQEITFDLSKNRFDCHLSKYKFHKYHDEENKLIDLIEVKPEKVYSLIHFMDNLAKMKAKIKIKIDVIKHYKEKDSEISKKVLESVKYYKIMVKTTNPGREIMKLSHFREINNLITEIDSYFQRRLDCEREGDRQSIRSNFSETFNPIKSIDDFNSIFLRIKGSNAEISYIHLHKFINKLKLFTYIAIVEKNIYELKYLNIASDFFKISYMEKLQTEYLKLQTRSKIILEGLAAILNFEGNQREKNKNFLHEINNFLDIFLKEAHDINLRNDLIDVASALQFLRNNKLRFKLFKVFEKTLKEESLLNMNESASEFDRIYDKYINNDIKSLNIPDEIINKTLSLHPQNLDYLALSLANKDDLSLDLKFLIKKIKEEDYYGLRNLHDRIHFLFTNTSDKLLDPLNLFHLCKGNDNLKLVRLIFRYLNNFDFKTFYKETNFYEYVVPDPTVKQLESIENKLDIDAVSNYPKIREEQKVEGKIQNRKLTLTFNKEVINKSILVPDFESKDEKMKNLFKEISLKINAKLYKLFDEELDDNNPHLIKNSIRSFILYFFKLKEEYHDKDSFLSMVKQELFLQIYRHLNRNDFTDKSVRIKTILGFLYIFSNYLEIPNELLVLIETWIKALIERKYFPEFCKAILNNMISLNNTKPWVCSSVEIEAKLQLKSVILPIVISNKLKIIELVTVNEYTTVSEINEKILKSESMSCIEERDFYWLYFNYNNSEEYIPLYSEEYILEVLGVNEQILEKKNTLKSYDFFKLFNICLRRRIFSPIIVRGDLNYLQERELWILYDQMETNYLCKYFSSLITEEDSFLLSVIITEFHVRKESQNYNENDLLMSESFKIFVNSNNNKLFPKFKKQIFLHNNYERFIEKFKEEHFENNLSTKNEKELIILFLNILRTYKYFFSSTFYLTNDPSVGNTFPDEMVFLVNDLGIFIHDDVKFELVHNFDFTKIIYIFFNSSEPSYLLLSFQFTVQNEKREKRCKLTTEEARCIVEDILSYSQYKLFHYPSQHVDLKKLGELKSDFYFVRLKDYKFIFQSKIPHLKEVPSITDRKLKSSSSKLFGTRILPISRSHVARSSLLLTNLKDSIKFNLDTSDYRKNNNITKEENESKKNTINDEIVLKSINNNKEENKTDKFRSKDNLSEITYVNKTKTNEPLKEKDTNKSFNEKIDVSKEYLVNKNSQDVLNNISIIANKNIDESVRKSSVDNTKKEEGISDIPIKKNTLSFEHLNKKKNDSKTSLSNISNTSNQKSINNNNVKALNPSFVSNEKPKMKMPQLNPNLLKNSSATSVKSRLNESKVIEAKSNPPEKRFVEGGTIAKNELKSENIKGKEMPRESNDPNSSSMSRKDSSYLAKKASILIGNIIGGESTTINTTNLNNKSEESFLIPEFNKNKEGSSKLSNSREMGINFIRPLGLSSVSPTQNEIKDENKFQDAKSNINKALSMIPNQKLIERKVSSKGIDPTTNIKI